MWKPISASYTGAQISLCIESVSNQSFRTDYTPDLSGSWSNVSDVMASGRELRLDYPAIGERGYYRIYQYHP
jgi:hypothetical protein